MVNKLIKIKKNQDLAYLIGVVMGDGCLTSEFSINIKMIDREVLECIRNIVGKFISFKHKQNINVFEKNRKPMYSLDIRCRDFYNFLDRETKHKKKIPIFIINGTSKIKLAFLIGILDAEGSVNDGITMCSVDKWIKDVWAICNDLNIKTSLVKKQITQIGKGYFYYFYINAKSFINAGGRFVIKRKQKILNQLNKRGTSLTIKKKQLECLKCNSKNGYYNHATNQWVCRKCHIKTKIKVTKRTKCLMLQTIPLGCIVKFERGNIKMNKLKCPKCGSTNGYYKHSTDEWVCRKCPTKTKVKKGGVK